MNLEKNHVEWFKPIKYFNKLEINYWLEQWYLFYDNLINNFQIEILYFL